MSVYRIGSVAAALVLVAGLAPRAHAWTPSSVTAEQTFAVSGTADVTLRTFDGSIRVTSWDRSDVHVTIEKQADSEAEARDIAVDVTQSGNQIVVEVERHAVEIFGFGHRRRVNLTVSVPRRADVTAQSGDGDLSVTGVSGHFRLRTGDGRLTASDLSGELNVRTGDGHARLDRVSGTLRARTGDGGIRAAGRLSDVEVRSGDGSVHIAAAPGSTMASDWIIRTGDGAIGLDLPAGFNADIDAHTGDGGIAMNGVAVTVSGRIRRNAIQGRIGRGGHELMLRTGDGTITLSRR